MRQRERSDHAVCSKFFSMEGEFPTLDCGPLAGRNTCNKKGQERDYCEPLAKKAFLKGDKDLGKTSPGWSCPGTGGAGAGLEKRELGSVARRQPPGTVGQSDGPGPHCGS